ncbi:HEAT repeat domain-containing protein [bacterium]|nr:HEAT repeat domain-containing protein [bacterium]
MIKAKYLTYLIIFIVLLGCKGKNDKVYQGLPLKTWIIRLDAPEKEIRIDAMKVITEIGEPAISAEPYLRQIARKDKSPDVKMNAIMALEAINAATAEFQDFIEEYNAPIIPEDEEFGIVSEEEIPEEAEEVDFDMAGDDLEYLQDLEAGLLDNPETESTMIPQDSAELAEWVDNYQIDAVADIMNQLSNPTVLAMLLNSGSDAEKLLAATKLAEMEGSNSQVVEALENAVDNPQISELVKQALKRWEPSE